MAAKVTPTKDSDILGIPAAPETSDISGIPAPATLQGDRNLTDKEIQELLAELPLCLMKSNGKVSMKGFKWDSETSLRWRALISPKLSV